MTTSFRPDTCYCVIHYTIPNSDKGKYITKCRVHQNSRNVKDVWDHNFTNRVRSTEFTGTGKNKRPTDEAMQRTRTLKDST